MSEFQFAQREWLHAIWGVLAIAALLVGLELRGQSLLDRMISPLMQGGLVRRNSLSRRLTAISLLILALGCLVLAMMRPQWGMVLQQAVRVDAQIMICLDVSKSMLAEDAVPNRLDRARAELDSLLGLMNDGQQAGLTVFAGKSAVVCPLTTDFGFLRLVLSEVGPGTVGLGGSRIGDALGTAVDGFREAGDIGRMILLVTDGEDHDSFPMDAARSAREKGIRIVSIGFGDEVGSKIEFTDPQTGERSFVKDRDGNDVISRLDGGTLREIALETEGAYIPAGTGALDLESIYRTHLKSLLRGSDADEERVIRHDAFQWCVLAAMLLLVCSVAVSGISSAVSHAAGGTAANAMKAGVLLLFWAGCCGISQAAQSTSNLIPDKSAADDATSEFTADTQAAEAEAKAAGPELTPRESYNRAVALVTTDPDAAESLLSAARRDAGADGELRFRTLYNLGWVEVTRADALVESDPQQAVTHLQQAVNRFREAIRVRPDDVDSRHNLEVISRRILELNDSLIQKDDRSLEQRLDELAEQQRGHQEELRSAVVQLQPQTVPEDRLTQQYRRLAVSEQQLIANVQKFAEDARTEADAMQARPEEELTPQDRLRAAQLAGVLGYVESSRARMTKARSLIRRQQVERGFVRWSGALSDTKRARDQFRSPVEVLGILIPDTEELLRLTRGRGAADSPQLENQQDRAPGWLTDEFLQQSQTAMAERVAELRAVLESATAEQTQLPSEDEQDPNAVKMLQQAGQALPLLRSAEQLLQQSGEQLQTQQFMPAAALQQQALQSLKDAAELFFDLRRLIELVYNDERMLQGGLDSVAEEQGLAAEIRPALLDLQKRNLSREQRLRQLLQESLQQAAEATATSDPAQQDPSLQEQTAAALEAEQQRVELAEQLLDQAVQQMEHIVSLLETEESAAQMESMAQAADGAMDQLEELRRLYFSLIEHLRDTARRQADLNDETAALGAETDRPEERQTGPLASRQQQLQQLAEQIRDGLQQQSEQAAARPAAGLPEDQAGEQAESAAAAAEKFAAASGLVDAAQLAMRDAAGQLHPETADEPEISADDEATVSAADNSAENGENSESAPEAAEASWQDQFTSLQSSQQDALQKLLEAIELLNENQEDGQGDDGQNQQDQNDQQQDAEQQQQQQMNVEQLLQLIRDREAERRRDRQQGNMIGGGGTDRDW